MSKSRLIRKTRIMSNGKKGVPRYDARRTPLGGAVVDVDYCVMNGDVGIPSYASWKQMLTRCYSEAYKTKTPTYKSAIVCEEWKRFSQFKKWFDCNYVEGYVLDKDILVKGNKLYSPETCCFVPQEINALLIKHDSKRGVYPIGVSKHGKKYCARVNKYKLGNIWIGTFDTTEEAFNAYKEAKENYIKELSKKYYNTGRITEKVYEALLNYKVEITD